jgi:hypothetical protein
MCDRTDFSLILNYHESALSHLRNIIMVLMSLENGKCFSKSKDLRSKELLQQIYVVDNEISC